MHLYAEVIVLNVYVCLCVRVCVFVCVVHVCVVHVCVCMCVCEGLPVAILHHHLLTMLHFLTTPNRGSKMW